jgi:hypothetical protein
MFRFDHLYGFDDFFDVEAHRSNPVHEAKDAFVLNDDLDADPLAQGFQPPAQGVQAEVRPGQVHEHDHGEKVSHEGLRDVDDVDAVFCEESAYLGNDPHLVRANNRHHHMVTALLHAVLPADGFDSRTT